MSKIEKEILYKKYVVEEKSIPDISNEIKVSRSKVRYWLIKFGIPLRSRADGLRTDRCRKKISEQSLARGSGRHERTKAMREKQRQSMLDRSDKYAKGLSLKPSGYLEITKGTHKGKNLHTVIMELRLGRPLLADEVVHHIDRDKTNNSIDNLALMTISAHTRLHRYYDKLEGINRKRNKKGEFA